MDWIDLAQDGYKRRAVVNAVMNLRVPYNAEELSALHCTKWMMNRSRRNEWLYRLQENEDLFL